MFDPQPFPLPSEFKEYIFGVTDTHVYGAASNIDGLGFCCGDCDSVFDTGDRYLMVVNAYGITEYTLCGSLQCYKDAELRHYLDQADDRELEGGISVE